MRKQIILLNSLLLLLAVTQAQMPPQAFNYSAVARDASNNPISDTVVGIQISIRQTSNTGEIVFKENHFVNTDNFGLFNLVIGAGNVQSGSMSSIEWAADDHYLEVGMDVSGGTNFLIMGTTQLLSVPYALHAATAERLIGGTGNLLLPIITTNPVTDITSNSARFSGTISNTNGVIVVERGIVYSDSPNPTFSSKRIIICNSYGSGVGLFDTVTGISFQYEHLLNHNTTYYARAYTITDNNISAFGNEVTFTTLSVGHNGPGGGIVFFDKGGNIGGWRYLESATSDQGTEIPWGCHGTPIGGTQLSVGSGENNTSLIVAGCNEAVFAAKLCNNLVLGGQNDWFLPSRDEMNLMYINLHLNNIGNFSSIKYWTSSETTLWGWDPTHAWDYWFVYGQSSSNNTKWGGKSVRAIRAF